MRLSQRSVERWRQVVEEFQASGFTRRQYCELKKIKGYKLDYWRARFRSESSSATTSHSAWIPVQIKEEDKTTMSCGLIVRVGRVEIEVKHGFDARLLADVLRVVHSAC